MNHFYFPKSLYIEAHYDCMVKTNTSPEKMTDYALKDPAWFVEVVFSFLDGTPYPKMKDLV